MCSKMDTLWTPPEQKSRVFPFPSSQNLLRAGHVPVECISFQARTMAAAVSRAPFTAGASRCWRGPALGGPGTYRFLQNTCFGTLYAFV